MTLRLFDNPVSETERQIVEECRYAGETLITKHRSYGESALKPARIFSKADTLEQLRVRIDDKLSRVANGHPVGDEDVTLDLIGYLVLLRIGAKRAGQAK